jgi:hypothetical protein
MEYEGMVHALEEIRRLLKPRGFLIDIHPHPNWLFLRAMLGDTVLALEPKPQTYTQDVLQAEIALEAAAMRGLFIMEESDEFDFLTYAPSISDLRDHWDQINAHSDNPTDDEVLLTEDQQYERFREVLEAAPAGAEAVIHEKARMTRLRSLP